MNEKIKAAMEAVKVARENLDAITREVQDNCMHDKVVQYNSIHTGYPQRVCIDCGYSEAAWNWYGSSEPREVRYGTKQYSRASLPGVGITGTRLNTEFIKTVQTYEEIAKYLVF